MLCIGAAAAVVVAIVVGAIVAGAVVGAVLLAVEVHGLEGLPLHGGWTIWHHGHDLWLLLRGGCELDLLGDDGLLHLPHVRLHPCERCLYLFGPCDGTIRCFAGCQ